MSFDYRKEALKHIKRLERYVKSIEKAYRKANEELARIALSVSHPIEDLFRLKDYPEIKARVDKVIKDLQREIKATILNGEKVEWGYANKVNDGLVKTALRVSDIAAKNDKYKRYFNQNNNALNTFRKRRTNVLNLSERVWKLTDQYKSDVELGLGLGISDGRSAAQLSRDLRQYLNEPDKLFRRVRDEHGNLVLSKSALSYNPGHGVYRSSYKNAMRLTRTEINMAYRAADQARWKQLDFVLGYKIARSNNPYSCPVCESLQGNYPKDFVFTGWHPQCRCVITPILQDMESFMAEDDRIENGYEPTESRKREIKDVPENFKEWVRNNSERINKAQTLPYFIKDNKAVVDSITAQPVVFRTLNEEDFIGMSTRANKELGLKAVRVLVNNDTGYVGSNNSFKINACLRGDEIGMRDFGDKLTEFDRNTIRTLDQAISSNELKENIICWRTVDEYFVQNALIHEKLEDVSVDNLFDHIKHLKGIQFIDKGFTSASLVAKSGVFNDRPIIMKIEAPKGINAYITTNIQESEIIFGRSTIIKVKSISRQGEVIIMACEIKP